MTTQLPVQEYKQEEYISSISDISNDTIALQDSQLAKPLASPATDTQSDLEHIGAKISDFLAKLPKHTAWFYSEYKLLVDSFVLMVVVVVILRLATAVVNAFNTIPLFKEFFQLVGIGYTTWFLNRYLTNVSHRR
ncbi:MAG: CAAD domain-containing protein [Calothrix sp. C42_A2020_038]|nr:CAAD domain-containing protein [Calothrix sp. C42_A2020_038]